jgi:hypothetical protein
VGYDQLQLAVKSTPFIEDEQPPADAQRVGTTWRYVNKSSGPDRRFNNNREMLIMKYTEIHLASSTGLNEMLQVSNETAAANFVAGLRCVHSALPPERAQPYPALQA